jgi:16S rRNA (uracil1498-N3)-methyltransferase
MPSVIPRCYVPDAAPSAGGVALPAREAHHVIHVMRLGEGAALRVFDGAGHEWHARLARQGRHDLVAVLGDAAHPVAEPPVHITLAQAVLKAEYMDDAVRDASMIGVAAIQPLSTTHSAGGLGDARVTRLVDRWQRVAIASVKQCGRAVVPRIERPRPLSEWLSAVSAEPALKLVLAEPAVRRTAEIEPDLQAWRARAEQGGAIVLVGPEGGWSTEEIDKARGAGFTPWTMSPRVLRADAVPVVALSVLLYAWERPSASATQSSSS